MNLFGDRLNRRWVPEGTDRIQWLGTAELSCQKCLPKHAADSLFG